MTETSVSTTRTGGDGRRTLSTTRPGRGGEMTRRSHLVEVEEELAKEMEEDSHHHHPEEMEINLVVNIDRRVSLMVTFRGLRLLKYFPHSPNVSKSRRDHLLHLSQLLEIFFKNYVN